MKNIINIRHLLTFLIFIVGNGTFAQSNPAILFTHVPEWGNTTVDLTGKVNANPQYFMVAGVIFIQEAGGWWTKPTFENPSVPIAADSTFAIDFTGGGLDYYATRLMAVLVPKNYTVPLFDGVYELPADFLENPYAVVARPHGDRTLEWSGLNWAVKRSVNNTPMGPGPNIFSSGENQVFIDSNECLHLKIINNGNDQWLSSEVIADTSFGFGKYTFKIKSRIDDFDINAINGLFTWDDIANYSVTSPDDYYREYDFEFGYWSIPGNDVAQYVVQPWDQPGNIYRFPMGADTNTTHIIIWKKDTVVFRSLTEDSTVINEYEYTGNDFHSPGEENVRINLWMIYGIAPQSEQEVVISGFEFANLLSPPQDVSASDGDTLAVTVTWNAEPGMFYGVYRGTSDNPAKAVPLNKTWVQSGNFSDSLVNSGTQYFYWVRSSDNAQGSNTTGYSSGFSAYDTGWASGNMQAGENPNTINFLISPNPCNNIFRVNFDSNDTGLFQIFDISGKLISSGTIFNGKIMEYDRLAPGIYIGHLILGNISYSAKILVAQ